MLRPLVLLFVFATPAAADQASLAATITTLFEDRRETGDWYRAELNDCILYHSLWREEGTLLWGASEVDLKTAEVGPNLLFEASDVLIENLPEGAPSPVQIVPGSYVVGLDDGSATFGFRAPEGTTIEREMHLDRTRASSAQSKGLARPSPRGNGESHVFFDSARLSVTFEHERAIEDARRLEAHLLTYQERYCRLTS